MLNIGVIDHWSEEVGELHVDIDDNGFVYIKQDDEWIAFPVEATETLIQVLFQVAIR